jgi:hypothetical protein
MLERWLDARDALSLRRAWTALAPVRRVVSHPHRWLTVHGAAELAGAMTGVRAEWIVDLGGQKPTYQIDRDTEGCFVDLVWDVGGPINEGWTLHERREGARGVQVLTVSCGTIEGRPEGGVATVVRVFDRDRAASVVIGSNVVATIGDVDLAPLDLYLFSQYFEMPATGEHVEMVRGFVAQLAAELDAYFDTSSLWTLTGRTAKDLTVEHTFGDGERALTIAVKRGKHPQTTAEVHGLPWGHKIELSISPQADGVSGYVVVRLPDADIDRVMARLGAIATLR